MAVKTKWWHTESNTVVCTLCPRECHIPNDSRGFCFVRANVDGELELTTDGRSSGFCIDPIEKKPLNHFLPGTPILSFGTAGCNLGCKFCQNWDISKSREMDRLADEASPQAIIEAAKQSGCRSIAFTYNDPIIWAEYAIEIAKVARDHNIKTVAVTAGYISPDAREEFFQWIDAANVDLKAFTESFYRRLTQTHLQPVLDTLVYLKHETDVWFEITNLIIPGENDSPQELQQMCEWIVNKIGDDVPVHFTAFHPDFKMVDKPRTPPETLRCAQRIALDSGIKYAYVGNVYDKQNQSTYCPSCHALVIERDWYELGEYHLDDSRCSQCGQTIPGVFEVRHGNWGRKRIPITIGQADANHGVISCHSSQQDTAGSKEFGSLTKPQQLEPHLLTKELAKTNVPKPKTSFTEQEMESVTTYTRCIIEAVANRCKPDTVPVPAIGTALSYGVFVTLKRMTQLRACCGRWGTETSHALGNLLMIAATDSATSDLRFARITPEELPLLSIEVSLIFNPQPITEQGEDRISTIEIDKHGLAVDHPLGRGLLLPQAATEARWDAKMFLDQVCCKAGLPEDTWRRDTQAELITFQTNVLTSPAPQMELDPIHFHTRHTSDLIHIANLVLQDQAIEHMIEDWMTQIHVEELGLYMQTRSKLSTTAVGPGNSLIKLVQLAVHSLREICTRKRVELDQITRLTLLREPIHLAPDDYPNRHRSLTNCAILGRRGPKWSLSLPETERRQTNQDRIGLTLSNLKILPDSWQSSDTSLTAFTMMTFKSRQRPSGLKIRQSAMAGQFYPADPKQMNRQIDACMDLGQQEAADEDLACRRAIMLPHAGWMFCGNIIGRTLARSIVPATVIIIGPKHTALGANWSIAPHTRWDIPGASIPIATELGDALVKSVPNLEPEPEAHRMEHGSEVLIPFLYRLNPKVRILPIAIGQTDYDATDALAESLSELSRQSGKDLLLVISSDMNHFAPEAENRYLDRMALEAMCTGDPWQLYNTCTEANISMCGMLPACIVMRALRKQSNTLNPRQVAYANSAAATGDASRVVGYAGVLLD